MKTLNRLVVTGAVLILASFSASSQPVSAAPHTMVYKTKIDYSKYVSVELTPDKKKISAYPAPADITPTTKPVKLKGGYWLSKTAISANTAYLAITCEDYSGLKHTKLTPDQLYLLVRDKSPMTEIWDCGVPNTLTVAQLNSLIENKQLKSNCRQVK